MLCTGIIDRIASDMRGPLAKSVLHLQPLISIFIDESTSLNRSSCMVVDMRTNFDENVGPVIFFLDVVELSSTTAEGIEYTLLKCLSDRGFSEDFLLDHWIG